MNDIVPTIVLDEKEVATVNAATSYVTEIKNHCKQLVATTINKCKHALHNTEEHIQSLQDENIHNFNQKVADYSLELQQQNYALLEEFLTGFEHDALDICRKIIDKLGVVDISNTQITNLIKNELTIYFKNDTLVVTANVDGINYLKQYLDLPEITIKYIENDGYADGMCQINDGMSLIMINLKDAADKIQHLLVNTNHSA